MVRRVAAVLSAVGLAAIFMIAVARLPRSGHGSSPVGSSINARTVEELHATDAVSAVTFDYRGVDTLGEEYILFASILGAVTILRRHEDEDDDAEEQREDEGDRERGRCIGRPLDAVRTFGGVSVLLMVATGGYVTWHGQVSPGGGFQGGVILATAPLVVYLASDARTFSKVAPDDAITIGAAVGLGAYVVIGAAAVGVSLAYLTNVFPLGRPGDVISAGTILALSVAVGLAVGAGLVSLALSFMHDAIARRLKAGGSR